MPLCTKSDVPLSFDTLPALKATHFYAVGERETVFSYVKLYVLGDALHLQFSCFESPPAPGSRCAMALNLAPGEMPAVLFSAAADGTVTATPVSGGAPVALLTGQPSAGSDEQGPYWAVSFALTGDICRALFHTVPTVGGLFTGNFFQYRVGGPGFGAAFDPGPGAPMTAEGAMAEFVVVPY